MRGASLRDDGTLCDISILQEALQEVTAALHYRDLDELDAFRQQNTTAEVIVLHIWRQIAEQLQGLGLDSLAVQLWESPQAYASYEAPVAVSE